MKEQLAPGQEVPYRGKIFEIVQTTQPDGRVFEKAVRAPGVRLIIANKPSRKLLLTREFRSELNDWDYRLPGGKVFDTLDEYGAFRESGADIAEAVHRKSVWCDNKIDAALQNLYAWGYCGMGPMGRRGNRLGDL
jgi:hypothetical protein